METPEVLKFDFTSFNKTDSIKVVSRLINEKWITPVFVRGDGYCGYYTFMMCWLGSTEEETLYSISQDAINSYNFNNHLLTVDDMLKLFEDKKMNVIIIEYHSESTGCIYERTFSVGDYHNIIALYRGHYYPIMNRISERNYFPQIDVRNFLTA